MDVKPLLQLGCAKVGSIMKGLPIDQVRKALNPNYVESAEPAPGRTPAATASTATTEEKKE